MKIIADVGGTRGRWVIVDKKIIKTIETDGFNPYSNSLSSLNFILDQILSSIKVATNVSVFQFLDTGTTSVCPENIILFLFDPFFDFNEAKRLVLFFIDPRNYLCFNTFFFKLFHV